MSLPSPPRQITILGALGDLTARLLLPAIAELESHGELPASFTVRGVAKADIGAEGFRAHVAEALDQHAAHVSERTRRQVVERLDYRAADLLDLPQASRSIGSDEATLVYAALPPSVFAATVAATAAASLPTGSRLALEKPFGHDLASARELNALLERELPHLPVSRIDSFLADELPRRVVDLRRSDRSVGAGWGNQTVEGVEIAWDETLGLEGRGYYDTAGALRDMLQNHLMAVLSLTAMEDDGSSDGRTLRAARLSILRAVLSPAPAQMSRRTHRARYSAGTVDGRALPAYIDEPEVDPSRHTETFAEVTLDIASHGWTGVPFTLRAGKALPVDRGEVVVRFKPAAEGGPRTLSVGIMEPFVRLSIASPQGDAETIELGEPQRRSAYANVLSQLLAGDDTWMVGAAEAEEQWRIVQPVLDAWRDGTPALGTYAAGTEPRSRRRTL